jgi:hypothetical protein
MKKESILSALVSTLFIANLAAYGWHFWIRLGQETFLVLTFLSVLLLAIAVLLYRIVRQQFGPRLLRLRLSRVAHSQILTITLVLLIGFAAVWAQPRLTCFASGGSWVRGGILGRSQYCEFTFPDGGAQCQSSNECAGRCIVTGWPIDDPPTYGTCQYTDSPFGCSASIEFPEQFVCTD